MSTVIADARAELQVRHRIGTHGSAPTSAEVDTFVRNAFVFLMAAVPFIQHAGVTLDEQRLGALPDDTLTVLFVGYRHKLLQATEWDEWEGQLAVGRGSVPPLDTVSLWYLPNANITSATDEVDSTDIFAQDRLAEAALTLAGQQIQLRLSASSASRSGGKSAQMWRLLQQERDELVAMLRVAPDRWLQSRMQKQQAQLALGVLPPADNPLRGVINLSRSPNLLTGDLS